MIDWNLVAKVTGGGFGTTILVLIILALLAWLLGLVLQKMPVKTKEKSAKGNK